MEIHDLLFLYCVYGWRVMLLFESSGTQCSSCCINIKNFSDNPILAPHLVVTVEDSNYQVTLFLMVGPVVHYNHFYNALTTLHNTHYKCL